MPRLLRPHIPLETRCRVALRQLGEIWPDALIDAYSCSHKAWVAIPPPPVLRRRSLGELLDKKLGELAELLGCAVADLHLDHDPSLGAREKVFRKGEHVGYKPDANDPAHLIYREAAAHRIKTNVRGEHGQHPDRVLIKKQRRREKKALPRHVVRAIGGRPVNALKASTGRERKFKWPTRPLRSASRWPKKGDRRVR